MLNIKEIALKLQATDRFRLNVSELSAIEFAEAIASEIAKQNEPVARVNGYYSGHLAIMPLVKYVFPVGLALYALPPIAEQIANETEWKPIETAPKDGTRIVVGYGRQSGFPMKIVYWKALHKTWMHYGEWEPGLERNATHWMPLPTPPKRSMEGV